MPPEHPWEDIHLGLHATTPTTWARRRENLIGGCNEPIMLCWLVPSHRPACVYLEQVCCRSRACYCACHPAVQWQLATYYIRNIAAQGPSFCCWYCDGPSQHTTHHQIWKPRCSRDDTAAGPASVLITDVTYMALGRLLAFSGCTSIGRLCKWLSVLIHP